MIRTIDYEDLEIMRKARNKWQKMGLFRQDYDISEQEQIDWYNETVNRGLIINNRAYGKIYDNGEVSFYGFDQWKIADLKELIDSSTIKKLHGECYQHNPFLTMWMSVGFKVVDFKPCRKYYNGYMWDSLVLELNK